VFLLPGTAAKLNGQLRGCSFCVATLLIYIRAMGHSLSTSQTSRDKR